VNSIGVSPAILWGRLTNLGPIDGAPPGPVAGGIETCARCGFCGHDSLLFQIAASGGKDNTGLR
jgi:hypothetical protein